jgi:hypothetical protein
MESLTARMTKACTIPEFVLSSYMLVAGIDTSMAVMLLTVVHTML